MVCTQLAARCHTRSAIHVGGCERKRRRPRAALSRWTTSRSSTTAPSDCCSAGMRKSSCDRQIPAPTSKQGGAPVAPKDTHLANLGTRRFASLRPSLPIGRKFRFDMNSGAASTPMVAPEGACRSRDRCRSSKRRGAVALVREQPPRRRRPGCSYRRDPTMGRLRNRVTAFSWWRSSGLSNPSAHGPALQAENRADDASSDWRPCDRRFRWLDSPLRPEAVALTRSKLNRPVATPGRYRAGLRQPTAAPNLQSGAARRGSRRCTPTRPRDREQTLGRASRSAC
jgi:hypothetical protein